jgi:hypothetical protein
LLIGRPTAYICWASWTAKKCVVDALQEPLIQFHLENPKILFSPLRLNQLDVCVPVMFGVGD